MNHTKYWKLNNPYENKSRKRCIECNGSFLRERFNRKNREMDGLNYVCRSCQKKQRRETSLYWEEHDPYLDSSLKYCCRCNQYLEREVFSKDRSKNDGLRITCSACRSARGDNYDPRKPMLRGAKNRAAKKDLAFDIAINDIVIPSHCPILNIPLYVGIDKPGPNSPTLDRIDNTIGYTHNNIQVISAKANIMKSNATIVELKLLVTYLEKLNAYKESLVV